MWSPFMWYSSPRSVTSLGCQCPKTSYSTTHPTPPQPFPTLIANSFFDSALLPPPHILAENGHIQAHLIHAREWGLPLAERGVHHCHSFEKSRACTSHFYESWHLDLNLMFHSEFHTHCPDCLAPQARNRPWKMQNSSPGVIFCGGDNSISQSMYCSGLLIGRLGFQFPAPPSCHCWVLDQGL